jgi:hypothetical protein
MELRQLEHFVAVAEDGSFTRAARRLNYVQSALTVSVQGLERLRVVPPFADSSCLLTRTISPRIAWQVTMATPAERTTAAAGALAALVTETLGLDAEARSARPSVRRRR